MMSDKLKQFIEDNREAFDTENPDPQLFKKLRKDITGDTKTKRIHAVNPLSWAAAIAGLIILSVVFYYILEKNDQKAITTKQPPVNTEEAGIPDPVYAKQIWHFKELIGLKQTELKQLEKEQPALYYQFVGDINKLDSAYRVLRTTLSENPNTEILLEAMIQNLQLQSDLLNRQLIIIKEIKQKSKSHEKNII
jgi:hypothetical protein